MFDKKPIQYFRGLIYIMYYKLINRYCGHFLVRIARNARVTIKKQCTACFGKKVFIQTNCDLRVFKNGSLVIGDGVTINVNSYIAAAERIEIEKGVVIGPNVVIVDHNHDYKNPEGLSAMKYKVKPIVIHENTWIAANVVILPGTNIGKNCVIGANCVVNGFIPDNCIVRNETKPHIIEYEK